MDLQIFRKIILPLMNVTNSVSSGTITKGNFFIRGFPNDGVWQAHRDITIYVCVDGG